MGRVAVLVLRHLVHTAVSSDGAGDLLQCG